MNKEALVFVPRNDEAFLSWLASNEDGFVLSSDKASYNKVHRANCNDLAGHRNLIRENVVKVCSLNLKSIQAWTNQNPDRIRVELSRCKKCDPPPML